MKVIIARPRGFCAGVERAIEIVKLALEIYGPPIYMRHAIVHNRYVVESLEEQGAVFVEEIKDIPEGSTVIFSAHGVSPKIWAEARAKNLHIIDATCPLVTKVHLEVKRYARDGYTILLVGHRGHVEVEGTAGEAPDHVILVTSPKEARTVHVKDPSKVAYVTQTTLSLDDTREIGDILEQRFPNIQKPRKPDICYATQNRQDAVKRLSRMVDVVLIIGSSESSNSNRLVEVARSCGVKAFLVEDTYALSQDMVSGALTVGLSSGASTPEVVVEKVIEKLKTFGVNEIEEMESLEELTQFPLPTELKGKTKGMRSIT